MDITKNISNLIATQFPNVYRESGEELVAFLEAYYEFLEQTYGYSEYMNREMFNSNDIDRTLDEFVGHFKEKYLSEFPYATFADKRFLVKHINDFYKSKGSEKSVKLLMKMIFGEEADVYYPAKDILKPSDSKWVIPNYIELESSDRAFNYVGRRVVGSKSKATAIVDGLVRKRANGKLIDVLYLSEQTKEFVDNDYITDDGNLEGAPRVDGSLREVSITNGGVNYTVGDIVSLESSQGSKAIGIVTEVYNPNDKVNIDLIDGGYGYTLDTNTVLYISKDKLRSTDDLTTLSPLDSVYQYRFSADYSGSSLTAYLGDVVQLRNSSNTVLGEGTIVAVTTSTIEIQWNENSSIPVASIYYVTTTGGNTIIGNITDTTVNGLIVGTQGQSVGVYYPVNNTEFLHPNVEGATTEFRLGGLTGDRYTVTYIESGDGFTVEITGITDTSTVTYNTNLVSGYLSVPLNSTNYGFPNVGNETLTTTLSTALSFSSATVGEVSTLGNFNPGSGYESDVLILAVNKYLAPANLVDLSIVVELDDVFPIRIGDKVQKVAESTNIGKIMAVTYLETKVTQIQMRFVSYGSGTFSKDDEIYFTSAGQTIPKGSGVVASSYTLSETQPLGANAFISANVQSAVGTIQTLRVNDSGFGYETGEYLTINALDNDIASVAEGTAIAELGGIGAGYWETTTSHLNSDKKIRDNYYYQEYSYEIQSGLSLDSYKDIVKNTVHVAGTELFGKVINKSVGELDISVVQSEIDYLTIA